MEPASPPAPDPRQRLTARERQYVVLVCRREEPGRAQIAEQMGATEKTVETHRANVYRKWGVHTRLELLYKAVDLGVVACPCSGYKGAQGPAEAASRT